jgi:hypothetical protein
MNAKVSRHLGYQVYINLPKLLRRAKHVPSVASAERPWLLFLKWTDAGT